MTVWRKARRKPLLFEFREAEAKEPVASNLVPNDTYGEVVKTKEGSLIARAGKDYIMRGADGEVWPINKRIFAKTSDILEEEGKGAAAVQR